MNHKLRTLIASSVAGACLMTAGPASAAPFCSSISYVDFAAAVKTAYAETNAKGIFDGIGMWATMMDRSGKVCHVYSVDGAGGAANTNGGILAGNTAWLGSRVISAQKANSANAFSLDGLALSTGSVSVALYPGGSLYGLQHSNPVDTAAAYGGLASAYGTSNDPMVGTRPGGLNAFGGGVALYDGSGLKVGAVGVSGDSSCRDHMMAYRLRIALGFSVADVPNDDGLSFTASPAALFEQPLCGNGEEANVNGDAGVGNTGAADDFGVRTDQNL